MLLTGKDISDKIIETAMNPVHNQFPTVSGLESPILATRHGYSFKVKDVLHVQIHHLEKDDHWVTTAMEPHSDSVICLIACQEMKLHYWLLPWSCRFVNMCKVKTKL